MTPKTNNELAIIATLKHFVSKEALDIKALNGEVIGLLVGHGFIKAPADLFSLKRAQPVLLNIMPVKVVEEILSSVEEKRKTTLARFIFALNIPLIGYTSSKRLARNFETIDALIDAGVQEIQSTRHIGAVAATNVYDFFAQGNNRLLIKEILDAGVVLYSN